MEKKIRVIARLDMKGQNVIKSIQFECLRTIGLPGEIAENYYKNGIDEIIYLDTVANLYDRSKLTKIVLEASKKIHIPLVAGGGLRNLDDIKDVLNSGADKVFINTAAIKNPKFIEQAANIYGSQCIVVSIEAKKTGDNNWEAYVDNGREPTSVNVIDWAKEAKNLGAGEIFLTSVDRDGTRLGLEEELINEVSKITDLPLVVSGGFGSLDQIKNLSKNSNIDGVAIGSALHYNILSIESIKNEFKKNNYLTRETQKNHIAQKEIADINKELKKDYNYFSIRQLKDSEMKVKNINDFDNKNFNIKKNKNYNVGIINFGINNLKSVENSLKKLNYSCSWIDTPEEVLKCDKLILPGIGSFGIAMNNLKKLNLVNPILKKISNKTPFLGICLGMQLLFTRSFEHGEHEGLKVLEGDIEPFESQSNYKTPHIGWTLLEESKKKSILLNGMNNEKNFFYFIHSFKANIKKKNEYTVHTTNYGNVKFCSAIEYENIFATQFHPEKSGQVGLKLLNNFLKI
jgi:imidazole glycerol phosphate synthase glutamine amidotransferase subunit